MAAQKDDPRERITLILIFAAIAIIMTGMLLAAYRLHEARVPVSFEDRWPDRAALQDWEIRNWMARLPRVTNITVDHVERCEYSYRRQEYCL